ncbi:MAG: IclR family transcriptional regulator [Hyphomicrobiaceae bacterium]|nr:IclR family transcriptional regulator [Hyphomicrobiaceae bacterium]
MRRTKPETSPRSAVDGGLHQSVARIDLVMGVLAANAEHGVRLMDVCRETGLSKTAAHRLLHGLAAYRLADFDERSSRYFVGYKIFGWASGAGNRFGLLRMAGPSLARLADRFGDAVYLLVRNGDEAVCVELVAGAFPIKTLALRVGDRRPLGIGAGALAMLSALSDPVVERILKDGAKNRASFAISDLDLRSLIRKTRSQGYALVDGAVIRGIATLGLPLLLDDGAPIAAISLSTTQDRLRPPRRQEIADAIRAEIAGISREFELGLTASNAAALVRSSVG